MYFLRPVLAVDSSYDDMEKLERLIRKLNNDASVNRYEESLARTQEIVDNAKEVFLAITAIDPQAEIAKLVVQRLEEHAILVVQEKLRSDLNKIARDGFNQGLSEQEAQESIRVQENWVRGVTAQAISASQSHVNNVEWASAGNHPVVSVNINRWSFSSTTSNRLFSEGTALRQLRDVAAHGWSNVLNEKRN
jgi:hypothetical protein